MIPTLPAGKVTLGPFEMSDAPLVERYAGDPAIARTTTNVPHPYPKGAGETWIASHSVQFLERQNVTFAIRSVENELVGAINLNLNLSNGLAELGYWIGVPFWNRGYGTAAARCVIEYGFETFPLVKIYARHLAGNDASGRVMEKSGMIKSELPIPPVIKNGCSVEVIEYSILRS